MAVQIIRQRGYPKEKEVKPGPVNVTVLVRGSRVLVVSSRDETLGGSRKGERNVNVEGAATLSGGRGSAASRGSTLGGGGPPTMSRHQMVGGNGGKIPE